MAYSLQTKIRVVILMAKIESPIQVWRTLQRENSEEVPSPTQISRIYKKFLETGSVGDRERTGRPKKYDENTINKIEEIIEEKSTSTLAEISNSVSLSKSTVHNILHSELGAKCYKVQTHQELYEEDWDRRLEMSEKLLPIIDNPDLENLIFFSDEATFHTSGRVHKQNFRIWGYEKPNYVQQEPLHSPKINVWCAMSSNCIIGPYFFAEETINSENYLNMLNNFFYPFLLKKRIATKIIFQQDGASSHSSKKVTEWLNKKFPNKWIGRRSTLEWAPRSPDLTPLDFFLWGYVKQKVYQEPIANLEDLREKITNTINSIQQQTIKNAFKEVSKRLILIQQHNGAHIEQFL
jgi:hypothetical protein